jgi:hypothetical protein
MHKTIVLKAIMMMMASTAFLSFTFLAFYLNAPYLGFKTPRLAWLSYVFTCVAMLSGIYFSSLYRSLEDQRDHIDIVRELHLALSSANFWRAMCVSPLVFMAVYTAVGDVPGTLPSILLAFQNGFFWENVLKRA